MGKGLERLLKNSNCLSSHGFLGRYCWHVSVISSVGFYGYRLRMDTLSGTRIKVRKIERMRTVVVERRYEQKEVLER